MSFGGRSNNDSVTGSYGLSTRSVGGATNQQLKSRIRKKIIVALKTVDGNETIDYWLTQYSR